MYTHAKMSQILFLYTERLFKLQKFAPFENFQLHDITREQYSEFTWDFHCRNELELNFSLISFFWNIRYRKSLSAKCDIISIENCKLSQDGDRMYPSRDVIPIIATMNTLALYVNLLQSP